MNNVSSRYTPLGEVWTCQLTFLTKLYMAHLMWSHTVIINADTMTYLHNSFICAFQ